MRIFSVSPVSCDEFFFFVCSVFSQTGSEDRTKLIRHKINEIYLHNICINNIKNCIFIILISSIYVFYIYGSVTSKSREISNEMEIFCTTGLNCLKSARLRDRMIENNNN